MMKTEESKKLITYALSVSAVAMVLYHFIFARYLLQSPNGHLNTHLGFSFLVLFLSQMRKGKKSTISFLFLILSLIAVIYVQINLEALEARAIMLNTRIDLLIGVILLVAVLGGAYFAYGPALPSIASFFILYMYFGYLFPPPLNAMPIPLDELIIKLSIGISGLYGQILEVSANFIFLFMIFAALIAATGAVDFFSQLGKLVGRFSRAGPAMASIITSGAMASISGAAGPNVMITGSFTIPAMKRIGYKPEQAGGIEAAASTGGPIMPPVMGVSAFIMSGMTGVPYARIILVAVIPALLYMISCAAYVELQARYLHILPPREEVDIKIILERLPIFVIPFLLIVGLFLAGSTPMFVGFSACISTFIISLLRRGTRLSFKELLDALIQGATTASHVGITCALLGIVVKAVVASGLAIKLPILVEGLFGDKLILLLIMTAVVAIILGCGLPAAAAYLMTAIVLTPPLLKLGIELLPAHLFVFFYANFSFITPPVAISAIFGAQLAKANYMKTAVEAAKVGIAGFILPFIIIFCPAVLFNFSNILPSVFMLIALIAALIIMQAGITGNWFKNLNLAERAIALVTSVVFMSYIFTGNLFLFFIGLLIGVVFSLWQRWRSTSLLGVSQVEEDA
jgi:TRAP transporter 4TM/12TM fusion protein